MGERATSILKTKLTFRETNTHFPAVRQGRASREGLRVREDTHAQLYGHGTAACYNRGCRCRPCTDANTRYYHAYRQRGVQPDRDACAPQGVEPQSRQTQPVVDATADNDPVEHPLQLRHARALRQARRTSTRLYSRSPCCSHIAYIDLDAIAWYADARARGCLPPGYWHRRCGSCRWPYRLRLAGDATDPRSVEWEAIV